MKKKIVLFCTLLTGALFAQKNDNTFWSAVSDANIRLTGVRQIVPQKYQAFHLNSLGFKDLLFSAPNENMMQLNNSDLILSLPLPNGEMQKFKVVESPIMEKALYNAYPNIKTFSIKGVDDSYAGGKIDWTDLGFHASVRTPDGDFYIDPYCVNNINDYISYYTKDFVKDADQMIPEVGLIVKENNKDGGKKTPSEQLDKKLQQRTNSMGPTGAQLRTYRLAVACTGEYAIAATGLPAPTVAQTLAKIVTSVNRVDGVYETEVAVRMVLVATETLVVYTNGGTDPFNGNNNANTLINESQTIITASIGAANFDIGHTFSTGGGGLAQLGCVCTNADKASGITGDTNPVGDPYDIDYVAHEMGHQFGGNHSFNATSGSCGFGNRNGGTAMEPGSGVTIMGYAGICNSNDIASHSIPYFHAISFDEIVGYTVFGNGFSCPVTTTTGNSPPVVTGGGNYVIPKSTAFVLNGSATDPNSDPLTYSWEEFDAGLSGANWNSGSTPYFRSYNPVTTAERYFPLPSIILTHSYTATKGEYVPPSAQTLLFRLTARDNKMGGGGVAYAYSTVTVDASGPFLLTYPNASGITWYKNGMENVQWSVNGTDVAPVSCDTVRILLSYDNGSTYTVLNNSTPNDGSQIVAVPTLTAPITTCRVKIEGKGNIFLDVSNNQFTISDQVQGIKVNAGSNFILMNVWPNPANDKINVSANNLNSTESTMIKICDLLGKSLIEYSYRSKTDLNENLDISELSKGVYFVNIINGNRNTVCKLIKE